MMNPKISKMFDAAIPVLKQENNGSQIVPDDYLEEAPIVPKMSSKSPNETDACIDIDYTRRTLQFGIERSQQLVDIALHAAAEASSPRDIEVAAGALNTCANVAEKLIDLQIKYKQLLEKNKIESGTGNTFVNNNNKTIVLTSSELLKQMIENEAEDIDVN